MNIDNFNIICIIKKIVGESSVNQTICFNSLTDSNETCYANYIMILSRDIKYIANFLWRNNEKSKYDCDYYNWHLFNINYI